jgi:hypothetical protein
MDSATTAKNASPIIRTVSIKPLKANTSVVGAVAGPKKKTTKSRGAKKQADIDDKIDLEHILRHWNYCHKKYRYDQMDKSEQYVAGDFPPPLPAVQYLGEATGVGVLETIDLTGLMQPDSPPLPGGLLEVDDTRATTKNNTAAATRTLMTTTSSNSDVDIEHFNEGNLPIFSVTA